MNEPARLTALVADDEAAVQALTARALRAEGFHCDTASDGLEAKTKLGARKYDVLVSDLKMPKMHGHALLSEVLAAPERPLTVVLTGVIEPKLARDLIARGVDDIVFKPTDYPVFAAKVRGLLDRRSARENAPGEANARREIDRSTAQLETQLVQIQSGFQQTVDKLKKQGRDLEDGWLGSVRVLADLIESAGRSHGSHAVRVEELAQAVAGRTGLDPVTLRSLKVGALLHDVGQFGMPDEIRKTAPWDLGPAERVLYERYPIVGATLLSQVPGSSALVEIVEAHAENFDGSGFPQRRKGPQIPLAARVLRLADGLDTHLLHAGRIADRDAAAAHLRAQSGKAYDPKLVELALAWLEETADQPAPAPVIEIAAAELRPGVRLAQDVYDESWMFLARQGVVVTEAMLQRLQGAIRGQRVKVFER